MFLCLFLAVCSNVVCFSFGLFVFDCRLLFLVCHFVLNKMEVESKEELLDKKDVSAEITLKERQILQKTLLTLNLMVMKKMKTGAVENRKKVMSDCPITLLFFQTDFYRTGLGYK